MGASSRPTIGIVGVGRMGVPVIERLSVLGYPTLGYRRTWPEALGHVARASSPREIADRTDIVITCLPSDVAMLEVVSGEDGLTAGEITGKTVIDIGMTALETKHAAREALETVGASMLDAPISGTPPVTAAGKATLFVSGEETVYDGVRPVLEFAAVTPLVGPFGAGTKLKFIANLLIGIHIAAAAEAVALAERAEIDLDLMVDLLSGSVAASEMFRYRAPQMVRRDFDAPMNDVNSFLKDVELIGNFASATGSTTALFPVASELYRRAAERGLGEKELASVVTLLTGA